MTVRDIDAVADVTLIKSVKERLAHGEIFSFELKQERERLRQLEASLAYMNRVSMMGDLAASRSHEIKQPIAAAVSNGDACLSAVYGELGAAWFGH
jgi:C4-dicarboxylate-specific signal transduction histidine kinase